MQNNTTNIRELLQETAYILKQHIILLNENEKVLPVQIYEKTLQAINELDSKQDNTINNNASDNSDLSTYDVLIASGLVSEGSLKNKTNKGFITYCNNYVNDAGIEEFIRLLERVNVYKQEKQIRNIYAFITQAIKMAGAEK